jgi:hypothetical protein
MIISAVSFLMITAYSLYYLVSEDWHPLLVNSDAIMGLLLPLTLFVPIKVVVLNILTVKHNTMFALLLTLNLTKKASFKKALKQKTLTTLMTCSHQKNFYIQIP